MLRVSAASLPGGFGGQGRYDDLSDIKVGRRLPFTRDKFDDFFRLLPERADSDGSWTVAFSARKKQAAAEAEPFKQQSATTQREANRWREQLAELKKAKPKDAAKIEAAEERIKELTREARETAGRAEAIESAVYDLKGRQPKPPFGRRRAHADRTAGHYRGEG